MSTLVAQTISNGTVSTSSANVIQGSAKAWVNFNGTGTVAIRASYNVSSITDNGTGDYTVNFTNAMPDFSYAAATQGNVANNLGQYGYTGFEKGVRTASSYRVQYATTSGYAVTDCEICTVTIFR
jgi:hypothetical protein